MGFSFFGRSRRDLQQIREATTAFGEGIVNLATLTNDKLSEIVASLVNEQHILNDKLGEIVASLDNERRILHEKLSKLASSLEIERQMVDERLSKLIANSVNQQRMMVAKLDHLITLRSETKLTPERVPSGAPLRLAPGTYNTEHPDYDASLVSNFPGHLLNSDKLNANRALGLLRELMQDGEIADAVWDEQFKTARAELMTAPGAAQLFEHKEKIDRYFTSINERHEAVYKPGWVNVDDALFLYWLIRRLRPRTVVETGVCNGFSSGVAALALAINGDDGKLHAIGRGDIFDATDPKWTEKGKIFGEVVVGGKSLGWMIPDACRPSVKLYRGNAEAILPETVDKLDHIDLFFHDSDHSYHHMMFEFREAKRVLSPGGIIVADNIAWNSSLWDFADEYGVPAYNFRGSMGAAFF